MGFRSWLTERDALLGQKQGFLLTEFSLKMKKFFLRLSDFWATLVLFRLSLTDFWATQMQFRLKLTTFGQRSDAFLSEEDRGFFETD